MIFDVDKRTLESP